MHRLNTTKVARLPGGVELPYLDHGSMDALPILLLHGITDSCLSFETTIAHMPSRVRTIAPSLRGHGDASVPDSYRLEDFAGDVAALIDVLSLDAALIVGHSMGAAIAQQFAISYPERTLGLVLVGAFAALARNPSCIIFGKTAIEPLADPVDPLFVREFQESTVARPLTEGVLDLVVSESLKVPARVWKAAWSTLVETDLTPDLPRIRTPTILVWGDQDELTLRAEQEIILRSIPAARLATFAGAGHAPHWEEPARFAALVAEFGSAVPRVKGAAKTAGTFEDVSTAAF
jgi:pimeloyl-ACP methyl ester carboxylesterase